MYKETLHPDTRLMFDRIASKQTPPYHLIGGTALALYLWHRESIDLDFVTYGLLTQTDKRYMKNLWSNYEVVYESDEQIDLFIDNVKCTLFSYRWKPMFPLLKYDNILIRDIRDIAISKANTIGRRSEIKDYIDLYVLLSEGHIDIDTLMTISKQKLWWDFSPKLFLKQLLLVDECESYTIPILWSRSIGKNIMNTYFNSVVENCLISS